MNPEHLELVQTTMTQMLANPAGSSRKFYERLFQLAPDTRDLFETDIETQGRKFMTTLGHMVLMLEKPEVMVDLVQKLGHDHAGFGVHDSHYDIMKDALIWTVAETLGDDFNPEVGAAWSDAYDRISTIMRAATANTPAVPAGDEEAASA